MSSKAALTDLSYSSQIVCKMDVSGYAIGILLTIIVFFAVYYYGYGVAMSVASEKTSRVMETLVVSAKPSRILLGKCLAMGVLGLVQLLAFLVVGAVCFATIVPTGFTIMACRWPCPPSPSAPPCWCWSTSCWATRCTP